MEGMPETDSKKKENELMQQVRELDRKLDWYDAFCEYQPEKK